MKLTTTQSYPPLARSLAPGTRAGKCSLDDGEMKKEANEVNVAPCNRIDYVCSSFCAVACLVCPRGDVSMPALFRCSGATRLPLRRRSRAQHRREGWSWAVGKSPLRPEISISASFSVVTVAGGSLITFHAICGALPRARARCKNKQKAEFSSFF